MAPEVIWNAVHAPSQMNGGMATAGNPATPPSPETVTNTDARYVQTIWGPVYRAARLPLSARQLGYL